jgi:hypothetical protein
MEKHLIQKIMIIIASIGEVVYRMHDNFIGIYRNGIFVCQSTGIILSSLK